MGVTFHPRNEPKRITDAAIQLYMALDAGDGILVEVFCGPDENGRSELFFIIMKGNFNVLEILLSFIRQKFLIRFEFDMDSGIKILICESVRISDQFDL